jgi:hypothetical protein
MEEQIENTSVFEIAMIQLDKIADQLEKRWINKKDYDTQRLIILIDLIINYEKVTKEKMESNGI